MALDFPSSPTVNQTFSSGGRTWLWDGTSWLAQGLPLGLNVATFLETPSSANLATAVTDETGTGALVFATSPTLVTPALGTPSALVGTNITGTAAGLTAGNVTTNANLTGDVTSVGNATSIAAGVIVDADINASAAIVDTKLATISTAAKVSNSATTATSANTASAIVARDASGNFTAGTITAALTGNAATATALATGRTIAITGDLAYTSPSFDGTGNVTAAGTLATVATPGSTGSSTAIPIITINAKGLTTSISTAAVIAPAGTLSGNTLAAGVTASSLTSLGTIASLTATGLTVNDNSTLGSSNTDTVTFNARVASDINPATDNTYDLGVTGHEWRNLNIDGTANIDSLVADTADINGGTIDATTIGGSTAAAGAFTTLGATQASAFGSFGVGAAVVIRNTDASGFNASEFRALDANGNTTGGLSIRNLDHGASGSSDVTIALRTTGTLSTPLSLTSTGLNSTAIGATTPSTGAFSTLSATGAVTFDGISFADGTAANTLVTTSGGNVLIGTTTDSANGKLQLTSHTTSAGGIGFGTDVTLYRSAANTLKTDDDLVVAGALSSTGALAIGNTVNTVSPTSPNRTITMVIGGTTYYLHAKTTND